MTRAAEIVREHGVGILVARVLGETVYRQATLVERTLDRPDPAIEVGLPIEVRPLAPDEVDDYRRLMPETPEQIISDRIRSGSLCMSVWHEGRVVSVSWVGFGRVWIDYLSRWLDLAPDEAYEHGAFTLPEMRGRNLAPARFATLRSLLAQSGRTRAIGVIMPGNQAAYRTQSKVGYRPIGTLGWIGVGRWRHHFMRLDAGARAPGLPSTAEPGRR